MFVLEDVRKYGVDGVIGDGSRVGRELGFQSCQFFVDLEICDFGFDGVVDCVNFGA